MRERTTIGGLVTVRHGLGVALALAAAAVGLTCGRTGSDAESAARGADARPSILLVTLDTVRADAVGYASRRPEVTPHLDAFAARGVRFTQAYTVAPQTLTAHASLLTGLYPNEHGLRENGRSLAASGPRPLAERLAADGYRTAAFVSGFPLVRAFGLDRGFATYDDDLGARGVERAAGATTERAVAWLGAAGSGPVFLWVHYYDAHDPYEPPEPFRSRFRSDPYLGEIAAVDDALGRLLAAFHARVGNGPWRALVVGDHGEGRGEHGERYHGHLLYQGTMAVPLAFAGSEIAPAERAEPVSIRRVYDTILGWAGEKAPASLEAALAEVVLGEAMMPFLDYGWQPQAMAVVGRSKAIRAGDTQVFDLAADPAEARPLPPERAPRPALAALATYLKTLPGSTAAPPSGERGGSGEARKRLASLGYVGGEVAPVLRADAPAPRSMTELFAALEDGGQRFVRGDYRGAIPLFERVLARDPGNLSARLRLAVAQSALGHERRADELFAEVRRARPDSLDVRHYDAMHRLRFGHLAEAATLFESVLAAEPDRLPALEALASIRERQGDARGAADLLARVAQRKGDPVPELLRLGELRMAFGDTPGALAAFERARGLEGDRFDRFLELGVLLLDAGRLGEARDALERVPSAHPGYPMALFKRAQVAFLLDEPDRAERLGRAREHADRTTGPLIEREALFVP